MNCPNCNCGMDEQAGLFTKRLWVCPTCERISTDSNSILSRIFKEVYEDAIMDLIPMYSTIGLRTVKSSLSIYSTATVVDPGEAE